MGEKKKKDEGKGKKHDTDKAIDFRLQEGTALHFKGEKKDDDRQAIWVSKEVLAYEKELKKLQVELMKLQQDMKNRGTRVLVIFEGRDAAGKGGTIKRISTFLNPRNTRIVALAAPSDREVSQWYFQRYVPHLPSAGELVLFDRSWYNRAMVEPVMGFCTDEQHKRFLKDVPLFEEMLVKDGIKLFKFYFSVSKDEQAKRFESRKTDILKQYKLSPVDNLAQTYWDQYTVKKFQMLNESNRTLSPWAILRSDDKKKARLNCIKYILSHLDYDKKLPDEELAIDPKIVISGIDEIKHMEKYLFDPERLRG
ncbi:polyphosphate kinase 2 [uncultured Desulfobulbus sp.]|uniref:polyphosphate kinase 2 n=1 Tax=uncultured Desulfobulbus sp. TaxID=239745 RepID=UPI0029C905C2|nr:polyphosphate kinase 2 [uncultured Desulfobulbus sp.]